MDLTLLRTRIDALLATASSDPASWRHRAGKLGATTTTAAAYDAHPVLRRLRDLNQGWLDKPARVKLADSHPVVAGCRFAELIGLELPDDDDSAEAGPLSDFDPLNSVPIATVPDEDAWFSLLCLPEVDIEHWPIVHCRADGDHNVIPVAIDAEHFLREWLCNSSSWHSPQPLRTPSPDQEDALIDVMETVFNTDPAQAHRVAEAARHRTHLNLTPAAEAAERLLAALSPLCVLPA